MKLNVNRTKKDENKKVDNEKDNHVIDLISNGNSEDNSNVNSLNINNVNLPPKNNRFYVKE